MRVQGAIILTVAILVAEADLREGQRDGMLTISR